MRWSEKKPESKNEKLNLHNKEKIKQLAQNVYFILKEKYGKNEILENYDKCETTEHVYKYLLTIIDWYKQWFFTYEVEWYLKREILTFQDFQKLDKPFIKKNDPQYQETLNTIKSYYDTLVTKKYPISGYLVNKEELEIAKKYLNPEKYKSIEALFYGREDIKKNTQKELKKAKK